MKPRIGAQGSNSLFFGSLLKVKSLLFWKQETWSREERMKRDRKDMASLLFPLYRHGVAGS